MVLASVVSQVVLLVVAVIVFLILTVISCLILYKYLKENNTFVIKANNKRNKEIIDLSQEIGSGAEEENKDNERFSKLLILDDKKRSEIEFEKVESLRAFAENFRNFCAGNLKLYYSKEDIRSFIANLLTSKIMILQGMSGTGKTSIALAFEKYINNVLDPIAIQPMWKERSDLIGYFNEFTKKFNETPLLEELYDATFNDKIYIIVLDEVNIARVEYYFAEFLSLLEYPNIEQRTLEITNDVWEKDPKHLNKGRLQIGENVYFLGTANNDESTFAISDKVYDRAMVLNLEKKAESFEAREVNQCPLSNSSFIKLGNNAEIEFKKSPDYQILEGWINKINELVIESFGISFGNRMFGQILRYVPIYVACGGSKEEAFDDFVAKKILRKLEGKDFLKLSTQVKPFIDKLNLNFGPENMKKCKEYVSKYNIIG